MIKKLINKDLIQRAEKTFIQGFLANMIVSLNNVTSVDKTLIKSAIIGAVASGLSAVMNLIINYLNEKGDE